MERPERKSGEVEADPEVPCGPETLLELLHDEHARAVLSAVAAEAKPARRLVEELEPSRATVYRRLNRLEEVGLVESRVSIGDDGHHRQVYRARLDRVTVTLENDGLQVSGIALAD